MIRFDRAAGQRLERFLAPGNELELLNRRGDTQLTVALEDFGIELSWQNAQGEAQTPAK